MLINAHGIPGIIITLILRCVMQPVHLAQVPGDAAQPAETLEAGPALRPWVTGLQRGMVELRGVLADGDAKQLLLEVRCNDAWHLRSIADPTLRIGGAMSPTNLLNTQVTVPSILPQALNHHTVSCA